MRRKAMLVATVSSIAAEAIVVAQRRGSWFGIDTIVRCRKGHLFTTVWIPGASLKALRLGWWRWQRCPVGPHWSLVTPARTSDLSASDRQQAGEIHDIRLP